MHATVRTRGKGKYIFKQFRLAHLLQIIFCIAFVLGARSFWLAFDEPGIPTSATIALGVIVAILAERTRMHFALVALLVLSDSVLQYCSTVGSAIAIPAIEISRI
jgi:hypothetical protein